MLTRRVTVKMIGTAAFLAAPPGLVGLAWAQADERAIAFVKGMSDQLVSIVNSSDQPQQKRRRLKEVIDASVDVDDIAQFCLGRFWRIATPDQQHEYLALFPDLLVTLIASHLGEYQGLRIIMGPARTTPDTETVITTVERPDKPTMRVDWVVATNSGSPKIIDLFAEGTSLRLTKGADFTSYLSRHQYNIHALVAGMRQQIAHN
jgi:phospholipid transport system substrate-binding protein